MVTVYGIRVYHSARDETIVAPSKGTKERVAMLNGTIIPDTAEEVDSSDIDEQYRYVPKQAQEEAGYDKVTTGRNGSGDCGGAPKDNDQVC